MNKTYSLITAFINGQPTSVYLTVEREQLDVTSSLNTSEPDPDWAIVDHTGHYHAYTGESADHYPTLEVMTKRTPYETDDGVYEEVEQWYECKLCHDKVEPGRKLTASNGIRQAVPGPMSWTVKAAIGPVHEFGEQVSILVRLNTLTTYFGIAEVSNVEWNSGKHTTEYVGVGPLSRQGKRKVTR